MQLNRFVKDITIKRDGHMIKIRYLVLLGLILILLSGCAQSSSMDIAGKSAAAGLAVTVSPNAASSSVEASASPMVPEQVDYCTSCHTDKQQLIDSAKPVEPILNENKGEGCGGEVSPKEPWEKVLVNGVVFPTSIHGLNGCIDCHGGVNSPEKEVAHTGITRNPSKDPEKVCGQCHPDIVADFKNNLHSNLVGYMRVLDQRSLPKDHPALEEAFQDNCSSCHATCGECHVSRPNVDGGGFVNGHIFNRTPSMTENCTGCHGTRIGDEYMGKNEGLPADVHYQQASMVCVDCHSGSQMHGKLAECKSCHPGPEQTQLPPPDHRYGGIQSPRCESCHPNVATGQDDVIMHQMHGGKLSCQVCHSVAYSNCDGCHVAVSDKTGNPYYETQKTTFSFLIGRNPMQSYDRPYEYVTVRHVPVVPDTFTFYGKDLLARFDNLETWKYTTPHNIQRNTPQTKSCNTCHGDPNLFLTADKVNPVELKANRDVIVDSLPPLFSSGDQIP